MKTQQGTVKQIGHVQDLTLKKYTYPLKPARYESRVTCPYLSKIQLDVDLDNKLNLPSKRQLDMSLDSKVNIPYKNQLDTSFDSKCTL